MTSEPDDQCPFLVPVIADRLWLYPVGMYCHRPGQNVRVPAPATLAGVCVTRAYLACGRYQASAGASTGTPPQGG